MNDRTWPRQLPPLAGLCSFEQAQRTELSVEECVHWIKRHHYSLVRLHEIFTARITAEPLYELKTAFSLQAYYCAEHATALRQRVAELREPPLGLEVVPHPALKLFYDEILAAPTHTELAMGLYEVAVPALIQSLNEYRAATNPLADAPTNRLTRFCLIELEDVATFGRNAIECLIDDASRERLADWRQLLQRCLLAAGGISGRHAEGEAELADETGEELQPRFSATPYQYDPVPKRDERFQDSFNAGVNPEAFLYDERFHPRDKVLMMFYKRLRDIDVPEMMASILHQTKGTPW